MDTHRDQPLGDERTAFMRLTHLVGRVVMCSLARVRIEGLDPAVLPPTGPLIIAANHLSNADAVLVGSWVTPALGRKVYWLGKEEALRWPLVGWAMVQNGVVGIRRGAPDIEAFRIARRILDEGHVLVIFPEGTRSRTGGLQEAKDGLAILALRTHAPILPIGFAGTDAFWPRGRTLPRPGGSVTMRVGRPFRLPDPGTGADRRAAQHAATEELMRRIAELLPPRHRGVYADWVNADRADEGSMR